MKLLHEKTAIMVAVENNDKETVEYLLSQNVDRDIVNDEGKTARDIAEESGN